MTSTPITPRSPTPFQEYDTVSIALRFVTAYGLELLGLWPAERVLRVSQRYLICLPIFLIVILGLSVAPLSGYKSGTTSSSSSPWPVTRGLTPVHPTIPPPFSTMAKNSAAFQVGRQIVHARTALISTHSHVLGYSFSNHLSSCLCRFRCLPPFPPHPPCLCVVGR